MNVQGIRDSIQIQSCGGLRMLWHIPSPDPQDQGAARNSYFCTVATRNTTSKYFSCSISHSCEAERPYKFWMTAFPWRKEEVPSLLPPSKEGTSNHRETQEQRKEPSFALPTHSGVPEPQGRNTPTLLPPPYNKPHSGSFQSSNFYFWQIPELRFTRTEMTGRRLGLGPAPGASAILLMLWTRGIECTLS